MERARWATPHDEWHTLQHHVDGTGAVVNLDNAKSVLLRFLGSGGPSHCHQRLVFRFWMARGRRRHAVAGA